MKIMILIFCFLSVQIFANELVKDTVYVKKETKDNSLNDYIEIYDNNKTILVLEGDTYVVKPINIRNGIKIISTKKSTIQIDSKVKSYTLIQTSGALELENIILDGMEKVSIGIYSSSKVKLVDSEIRNIKGTSKRGGVGLRHNHKNPEDSLVVIRSKFHNMKSYEDGKIGNNIGSTRAIYTNGGKVFISNSEFKDILGEEDADCIHIQTKSNNVLSWESAGIAEIRNNIFENFGKRAIKIQASDVLIKDNFIDSKFQKISSGISIYGSNNQIRNNIITLIEGMSAININSGTNNILEDNLIDISNSSEDMKVWGVVLKDENVAKLINNEIYSKKSYYPIYIVSQNLFFSKKIYSKKNQVFKQSR